MWLATTYFALTTVEFFSLIIRLSYGVCLFVSSVVTMGNCYRVPRRARKDVTSVYRPSSTLNKSDPSSFPGYSQGCHNTCIGNVSRRAVSSSTSLQHISEREPDGEPRRCWLGGYNSIFNTAQVI